MANDTKLRLIETAGDLFYRHGFQAVGLDRILEQVGITKTAFYKHYDSKDRLIVAVLEHRDRRDIAEAVAYMRERGGADARAQLLAMFDQLQEWFDAPEFRGCLYMNAATEFPVPTDPIHRAALAHRDHLGAEMLRIANEGGLRDAPLIAQQLMLLVGGAVTARHSQRVHDAGRLARSAAEGVLRAHADGSPRVAS